MTLVGNKSDLHMQRTIPRDEGLQVATEWDCAWTEASARHNENVTRAFELCLEQIEKQSLPAAEDKKGCVVS
jgi:Ras homolog enriched in brain